MSVSNVGFTMIPGRARTGFWCYDCSLPSVARITYYALTPEGPVWVGVRELCTEPGHQSDIQRRIQGDDSR